MRIAAVLGIGLLVGGSSSLGSGSEPAAAPDSIASVAPTSRESHHDFTSRINGRKYRVMVSMPFKADLKKKYPVFYVLDGNWYFRAAADSVTESSGVGSILPAIVVGIGYPTDDNEEVGRRRFFELSLPGSPDGQPQEQSQVGGGDDFIRVLLEEVKPLVQSRYPVDETHQSIYGKSLGGLMVVRTLFRHPEAFQTYIAASPALFWNKQAVLADEESLARRARTGAIHLRLLITLAANEQYRGTDPQLLESSLRYRMIDNATELAGRMGALDPARLTAGCVIFSDEDHVSVSLASLGRGLTFALKP